jgi:hypothetical protein
MMRRFTCYRPAPPEGYLEQGAANPPDEPQFEGVVYSDGTCAVRWLTAYRSHSIWASLQDLLAIHGHPEYGTHITWHDGEPEAEPDAASIQHAAQVVAMMERMAKRR